jgi:hypothetical protein
MSRSRLSLVALLVIVLGLWHIYADHHARFVSELFEVDHTHVNDEQVQEILNHDKQILAKLQELHLENEKLTSEAARL